jgi:AcrR family transcriptional regulator
VNVRRSRILRAAELRFAAFGPEKTTMAEIAKQAGVAVGSLYLEFPSKEHIVAALSDDKHATLLANMSSAAARCEGAAEALQAALVARTKTLIDLAEQGRHVPALLQCSRGALCSVRESYERDEAELLRRIIAAGIAAGEFAADPGAERAAGLLQQLLVSISPRVLGADRAVQFWAPAQHVAQVAGGSAERWPTGEANATKATNSVSARTEISAQATIAPLKIGSMGDKTTPRTEGCADPKEVLRRARTLIRFAIRALRP